MTRLIFPRLAPPLLFSFALLVPACEPDECDLEFSYTVDGSTFEYAWHAPSASCSTGGSLGSSLNWSLGVSSFEIDFVGFAEGPQPVEVRLTDETGKHWTSTNGGLSADGIVDPSFCVATVTNAELVDWTQDDHWRVRGLLTCAAPLIDDSGGSFISEFKSYDTLQLTNVQFNIYAGDLY